MKKRVLVACVLALVMCGSTPLFADLVMDLNDPLYLDLELWQERGLLSRLPPLRPYPLQLVQSLLTDVEAKGTQGDRARAEQYLADLRDRFGLHAGTSADLRSDLGTAPFIQLGFHADLQGLLTPFVAYSSVIGAVAINKPVGAVLPLYTRPLTDATYSTSAPITQLFPVMSMGGMVSVGTDAVSLQAGITRSSFGPFWGDNVVLGPSAPQSGRVSFLWTEDLFTYTWALLDIAATSNDGSSGRAPDKFLALHSLELHPWSWLTFGLLESIVWGGRFEPLYLLPLPATFLQAQGMVGWPDNVFIGFSGRLALPQGINVNLLMYIDDAGFGDLALLRLNTMFKAAMQGGVSWTPTDGALARLSLSYMAITPYTYSHLQQWPEDPTAINYLNYTNDGQNMGPSLQPNSDRVELDALLRPVGNLDLSLFGRLIRHGNASEGIPGGGDGTLFDDGIVGGLATFTPDSGFPLPAGMPWTRFLTQSVIEKTLQAGVDAKAHFDTPIGQFQATLSYTFEYVWNAGLGPSNAMNNYIAVGAGYLY